MGKVLNVTYASSITDICEINSSFDRGVLRICYTGENRNKSYIAKEDIERNIRTIFNCPLVCNYNRETDTLGGHDMEVVRSSDGSLRLVNITQPIGVIPESARVWFEDYEEDDGSVHEYLYAEALLWKRQEAYQKIKKDGITAHSMEITVKNGEMVDGIYHIKDFEFTAFALIGVEPCYESSALEMFSRIDFKQQLSEMMQDLKTTFTSVNPLHEDDDTKQDNFSMEGGRGALDSKLELLAKYGIEADSLDFSIDDMSIEDLTAKLEAMKADNDKFALVSNLIDELIRVLSSEKTVCECCEYSRYWYVDCDTDACEVYCWDTSDWLLYGFTYAVDGDRVTIDFDSKKRKKYVIADFDNGTSDDQGSPFAEVFNKMSERLGALADIEKKFNDASDTIASMQSELDELRSFKAAADTAAEDAKREEVFSQFTDLEGIEAFDTLRANCAEYDLETLEEKCYAIRGRNGATVKFAFEANKTPKVKVEKTDISNEPYGGLFDKYAADGSK